MLFICHRICEQHNNVTMCDHYIISLNKFNNITHSMMFSWSDDSNFGEELVMISTQIARTGSTRVGAPQRLLRRQRVAKRKR